MSICPECSGIGYHTVNCPITHTPDPIYCPIQTRPARMYNDPEPADWCENEVPEEGDLCSEHDADARMDDDYDRYMQSKDED